MGSSRRKDTEGAFPIVNGLVIGFSGRIASGKSTIAAALAEQLAWPYVSFGAYVRKVARNRGLDDSSREVLQEVGESLIGSGWVSFCGAVLGQAEWHPGQSLIVDGIRHRKAYDTLKFLVAPSKLLLIYIAVDEGEQQARLLERDELDAEKLSVIESHSTEKDVIDSLPVLADLFVNGSNTIAEITRQITLWIKEKPL